MAQLRIDRENPSLWIVTFENPPINLIDPDTIVELQALLADLETDAVVKVHRLPQRRSRLLPRSLGCPGRQEEDGGDATGSVRPPSMARCPRPDFPGARRFDRRDPGSARGGAGSEFALACDMRFASLEPRDPWPVRGRRRRRARRQPHGTARRPDGAWGARWKSYWARTTFRAPLRSVMDTSTALCPMLSCPRSSMDLAQRLAGFEKHAIAHAKSLLDLASLPPDAAFPPALAAFFQSVARPGAQARMARLLAQGLQRRTSVELSLGKAVAER